VQAVQRQQHARGDTAPAAGETQRSLSREASSELANVAALDALTLKPQSLAQGGADSDSDGDAASREQISHESVLAALRDSCKHALPSVHDTMLAEGSLEAVRNGQTIDATFEKRMDAAAQLIMRIQQK
jgi:hypothetical protein